MSTVRQLQQWIRVHRRCGIDQWYSLVLLPLSHVYTGLPRRVFLAMPFTRSSAWILAQKLCMPAFQRGKLGEENLPKKVIYTIKFTSSHNRVYLGEESSVEKSARKRRVNEALVQWLKRRNSNLKFMFIMIASIEQPG